MAKADYYETLGVSRNATPEEIKAAYRKQALKFHPDRNPGNKDAEEKFKEANEAYSILSDGNKRQTYDQFGHAGVSGQGGPGFGGGFGGFDFGNLGDIFGDFFGEAFGGRRRHSARTGRDLRADYEVTLNEVLTGTEANLVIPNWVACHTCHGSGARPGTGSKKCGDCKGRGQLRVSQGFFTMTQTCPRCHGTGEMIEHPCGSCHGRGRVQKDKTVRVRIPPGVENGTTLRIGGGGEAGERQAPPGDLYVVVRVRSHKQFERSGANLFIEQSISFPMAALGGHVEVPGIDGNVKLVIPAGTQPGVQFRVDGRGLPHLKSRGRGDLYVQIQVEVPKKLKKEEKKLIQDLAAKMGDGHVSKDGGGVFKRVFGS